MPETNGQPGAPVGAQVGAYLLGGVAVACCFRLVLLAADDAPVSGEHFAWLAVCVIAATFSAACAVTAALRATESQGRARA